MKAPEAKDGDKVDVYIGPNPEYAVVYVIDQIDLDTRKFDEVKCMLGFKSIEDAKETYDAAFSDHKGPDRRRHLTTMSMTDYKDWLKSGDTSQPVHKLQESTDPDDVDPETYLRALKPNPRIYGELLASDEDAPAGYPPLTVEINAFLNAGTKRWFKALVNNAKELQTLTIDIQFDPTENDAVGDDLRLCNPPADFIDYLLNWETVAILRINREEFLDWASRRALQESTNPDDVDPKAYLDALPPPWTYKIIEHDPDYPEGFVPQFFFNGRAAGMARGNTTHQGAERAAKRWTKKFNDRQQIMPFNRDVFLSVWTWHAYPITEAENNPADPDDIDPKDYLRALEPDDAMLLVSAGFSQIAPYAWELNFPNHRIELYTPKPYTVRLCWTHGAPFCKEEYAYRRLNRAIAKALEWKELYTRLAESTRDSNNPDDIDPKEFISQMPDPWVVGNAEYANIFWSNSKPGWVHFNQATRFSDTLKKQIERMTRKGLPDEGIWKRTFSNQIVRETFDPDDPDDVDPKDYLMSLRMQPPKLDDFTQAYIEAALWSSMDNSDPDTGGEPLDANFRVEDISIETQWKMYDECQEFQRKNAGLLARADYNNNQWNNAEMAGHDFWLTRNGHGSGFWDRNFLDPDVSEALTQAAHKWGEVNLEVVDYGEAGKKIEQM